MSAQPADEQPRPSKALSRAKRQAAAEDGAALFDELLATVLSFIAMSRCAAVAVVLWAALTHLHSVVTCSPMLRIESGEKRSGKTTLLMILAGLVYRAISGSSITPAALFRVIDEMHPTLMLDESEHWFTRNSEITAIINAGHYPHTAVVWRSQGREHKPKAFSTWCPKVICGIGELADTTTDRCIRIQLRRKLPSEQTRPLRGDIPQFDPLRMRLAKWAAAQASKVKAIEVDVPSELNDRAADNWRPLLAIAEFAGGQWPQRARDAAIELTPSSTDEDSEGIRFLNALANAVGWWQRGDGRDCNGIPSEYAVRMIDQDDERIEARDKQLRTPHALAVRLKRFDKSIATRNVRWKTLLGNGQLESHQAKGYRFDQLFDLFRRLIPHVFKPAADEIDADDEEQSKPSPDADHNP